MFETRELPPSNLIICADSQAAIKALGYHLVKSKGVNIHFYKVQDNCGIKGNKKAVKLARKASEMTEGIYVVFKLEKSERN